MAPEYVPTFTLKIVKHWYFPRFPVFSMSCPFVLVRPMVHHGSTSPFAGQSCPRSKGFGLSREKLREVRKKNPGGELGISMDYIAVIVI